MSLKIIRAGLLDSIQDGGRTGAADLGIGPGGAMDRLSAGLANALLGKALEAPVLELHFPAAILELNGPAVLTITGADFDPHINGEPVPRNQPICITEKASLGFHQQKTGSRCYVSLLNGFALRAWLNSYSTHFKAGAGGFKGRALKAGDVIDYKDSLQLKTNEALRRLPWRIPEKQENPNEICFLPGPEWNWMPTAAQGRFLNTEFEISTASDRMGYRLQGEVPVPENLQQFVSSAVSCGTIQWLPGGAFIVLMADHQTTGGYPRIGQVASADLGKLAQMKPHDRFSFRLCSRDEAGKAYCEQQNFLLQLQNTCKLKMQKFLDGI